MSTVGFTQMTLKLHEIRLISGRDLNSFKLFLRFSKFRKFLIKSVQLQTIPPKNKLLSCEEDYSRAMQAVSETFTSSEKEYDC